MNEKTDYEVGYSQGLKDGQQLTLKVIDETFNNLTKQETQPTCKCERTPSFPFHNHPTEG
jgi:hypothetical protein